MEPTLQTTLNFTRLAHSGQTDKNGVDYYHHPVAVSDYLPSWATEDEFKAALLHDVVEDTPYSLRDLDTAGYSLTTLEIVGKLTKNLGTPFTSYDAYIDYLVDFNNLGVLRVKLADNIHNSLPKRIEALSKKDRGIAKKYAKVRKTMMQKLSEMSQDDFVYYTKLCDELDIPNDTTA